MKTETPRGEVVIICNEARTVCHAVTRQDKEGHILSVIWEAPEPAGVMDAMVEAANDTYCRVITMQVDKGITKPNRRDAIRAALEAALQSQPVKSDALSALVDCKAFLLDTLNEASYKTPASRAAALLNRINAILATLPQPKDQP